MTSSESDRAASRRTLLRRAAVTGGAAVAATAATAVNAAPASAAVGDPVTIGLPNNDAGSTALTSAVPDGSATLALRNDTGATLKLTDGMWATNGPAGSLSVEPYGLTVTGSSTMSTVFSTANATMLVPIPPTRILDTRSVAGRERLLEGGGRIDARGRVPAETLLIVHLADIVEYGDGMLGNITVADTERGGFATVWGTGDLPTSSTINWWTSGQLLSNGVITQLGGYGTASGDYYSDVVGIYVQKSATAVILDVTGLLVFHPESAVINNPKAASGARLAADSGGRAARAEAIKQAAESGDRAVRTDA